MLYSQSTKLAALLSLSLFSVFSLFAQGQNEKIYEDGMLFMKIKDNEPFFNEKDEAQLNKDFSELADLLREGNVYRIERPFTVLKTPVFDRTYKIFLDADKLDMIIEKSRNIDYIEYVEKIPYMKRAYTPNDPGLSNQYAMDLIGAYDAFDLHQGGVNTVVAIVDDAVDVAHEDLFPNRWINPGEIPGNLIDDDGNGYVDDVNGFNVAIGVSNPSPVLASQDHGTHVAGIAAAATDNGIGVGSIGFNVKIMSVKASSDITGNLSNTTQGIAYAAAAGADVINCSFGGPGFSTTTQNVVNEAHSNGILVVAAAGNEGNSDLHYPAALNNVYAVVNTTASDAKSSGSTYGTWVDICAPGTGIYSTLPNNQYGTRTGTSMASPMVAGLCALIKSFNPSFTPDQITQCIDATAEDINFQNPAFIGQLGAGRINAYEALVCASPNTAPFVNIDAETQVICPGDEVQFLDASSFGPSEWLWTFPGGNPSSSTLANPSVIYNAPGTYNVTLEATNEFGTNTETFNAFISVDENLESQNYLNTFELGLQDWTIENPDNGITWELVDTNQLVALNGAQAIFMNNYDYPAVGQRDALISPVLSLYARESATLLLDYSYRSKPFTQGDSLIIYVSGNGGATFSRVYADAESDLGSGFGTGSFINGSFFPNEEEDWCGSGTNCLSIDISSVAGQDNVVIKIENYNNNNNNLFIDNVEIITSCYSTNYPPLSKFEVSQFMGCDAPFEVQFFDNSVGLATERNWSFPGGTPSTSIEANPVVSYPSIGAYEVSLAVSNSSGSDTKTIPDYIVVSDTEPTASYDMFQVFNTINFTNTSSGGVTYFWDFGDGNTSEEESPSHTYDEIDATYEVKLITNNGCGSDESIQMIVATSIEDPFGDNTSYSVFPNPNSGQFTIEVKGKNNSTANVVVHDILGRTVHQSEYSLNSQDWKQQIDIKGQAAGTYIVKIEIDGLSTYEKIVIR